MAGPTIIKFVICVQLPRDATSILTNSRHLLNTQEESSRLILGAASTNPRLHVIHHWTAETRAVATGSLMGQHQSRSCMHEEDQALCIVYVYSVLEGISASSTGKLRCACQGWKLPASVEVNNILVGETDHCDVSASDRTFFITSNFILATLLDCTSSEQNTLYFSRNPSLHKSQHGGPLGCASVYINGLGTEEEEKRRPRPWVLSSLRSLLHHQ